MFTKLRRLTHMMRRKTKKMAAVEERFQQPLEVMLPPLVTERGSPRRPTRSA